ncbi:MAG: hypothetical protein ACK5B9_14375 [Flavobacteriia bacterium]|jgi:hypothetical protein
MRITVFCFSICFLIACSTDNKGSNKKNGIIVGSSKMDKQKWLNQQTPEMKRTINNLREANKGNVPTFGRIKDADSIVIYKKKSRWFF